MLYRARPFTAYSFLKTYLWRVISNARTSPLIMKLYLKLASYMPHIPTWFIIHNGLRPSDFGCTCVWSWLGPRHVLVPTQSSSDVLRYLFRNILGIMWGRFEAIWHPRRAPWESLQGAHDHSHPTRPIDRAGVWRTRLGDYSRMFDQRLLETWWAKELVASCLYHTEYGYLSGYPFSPW